MPKNKLLTPASSTQYAEFLDGLMPIVLGLEACSVRLERSSYARLRGKKGVATEIIASYRLDELNKMFFNASVSYKLSLRKSKTQPSPLVIEAVFEAHFHGDPPIKKHLAERFVNGEFSSLAWPYFRQLVLDTCAKMAIPRIWIPLLPKAD